MSMHEKAANEFASKHGVKLTVIGSEFRKYFPEDKECRYVFKMKIQRGRKSYTFTFGQSIAKGGEEPTMYDILSCFTKYDVGSFDDFCGEFGYSNDSRQAEMTYKAVVKEFEAVERLFGDVIDELSEIC